MTAEKYNECVGLYADALYRFILKNIREPEDARDVVQNAFEALWINRNEVNPEKIKSWLFTVAYHKMIDMIRKRKRMKLVETIPDSAAGSQAPRNSDLKSVLNQALETLPDIQKQLVLLKDYEGYSYTEIGQITGLNESQVKVYLFRARMSLKKTLVSIEQTL